MSDTTTERSPRSTEPVARAKRSPLSGLGFDGSAPLLEVENLNVEFHTRDGVAHAVNDVSFSLNEGETLGILGESGCGKSVTAQAIMGSSTPRPRDWPAARCATAASTSSSSRRRPGATSARTRSP